MDRARPPEYSTWKQFAIYLAQSVTDYIQVVVRCRPMNSREKDTGCKSVVTFPINNHVSIQRPDREVNIGPASVVLDPSTTQEQVYNRTARPLVNEFLAGYNVTFLTYGQTGTGKTFTLVGDMNSPELQGILPRAFEPLLALGIWFVQCSVRSTNLSKPGVEMQAGYFQIYNEEIRDLFTTPNYQNHPGSSENLRIRELSPKEIFVEGLTFKPFTTVAEVQDMFTEAKKSVMVRSTAMSELSSRSTCIFLIKLKSPRPGKLQNLERTLIVTDMSGSERISKAAATGVVLREAMNIAKSLSSLGSVISALASVCYVMPILVNKL